MKKWFFTIVLAASLSVLTACGADDAQQAENDPTEGMLSDENEAANGSEQGQAESTEDSTESTSENPDSETSNGERTIKTDCYEVRVPAGFEAVESETGECFALMRKEVGDGHDQIEIRLPVGKDDEEPSSLKEAVDNYIQPVDPKGEETQVTIDGTEAILVRVGAGSPFDIMYLAFGLYHPEHKYERTDGEPTRV